MSRSKNIRIRRMYDKTVQEICPLKTQKIGIILLSLPILVAKISILIASSHREIFSENLRLPLLYPIFSECQELLYFFSELFYLYSENSGIFA
jgi:hypothetical protein